VIAAAGANVVKRIGDAVMFVTNAPGIACSLALDLIESEQIDVIHEAPAECMYPRSAHEVTQARARFGLPEGHVAEVFQVVPIG